MAARFALATTMTLLLAGSAVAQTVVVNENFDGYADRAAFLAQWVPTIGNGSAAAGAADQLAGLLTDDAEFPSAIPDVQGKAVDHVGATASVPGQVNQWAGIVNQGAGEAAAFQIAPSATQNVFLSADIFVGNSGNERMSVGLRHISVAGTTVTTNNLVEMGVYNSNSADPTVVGSPNPAGNATSDQPGFYPGRGYGARINLFGPSAQPLQHTPDWQYFRTTGETWGGQAVGDVGIATELESTTDSNDFVSIGDIGAGWHTYTATITPTQVTITLDLFRDGKRNTSTTIDPETGERPGEDGLVDAQMVYNISTGAAGFNSLRIGGPSGLSSAGSGAMGFDNVLLQLVDVGVPDDNADFDGDGDVDGQDFLTWQRGLGGPGDLADGDANDDGNVTAADLEVWKLQFGPGAPAAPAIGAVPEPATVALAAAAMLAGLAAIRRR